MSRILDGSWRDQTVTFFEKSAYLGLFPVWGNGATIQWNLEYYGNRRCNDLGKLFQDYKSEGIWASCLGHIQVWKKFSYAWSRDINVRHRRVLAVYAFYRDAVPLRSLLWHNFARLSGDLIEKTDWNCEFSRLAWSTLPVKAASPFFRIAMPCASARYLLRKANSFFLQKGWLPVSSFNPRISSRYLS